MGFTNDDIYFVFKMYSDCLLVNCSLLNRLDENLSDRNHGTNLSNGFNELFNLFPNFRNSTLQEQFQNLSLLFANNVNGETSPIYCYVFQKISERLQDVDIIDREIFYDLLKITNDSVKLVGNCKLNDKTILDCINPCYESFDEHKTDNTIKLLKNISVTSKIACESTADMVSKKGKARHNAVFSVGVIDPGCYSMFLFFDTLYKYALKKRRTR